MNCFNIELLDGYVVVAGALLLILGPLHHGIAALNLAFPLSKPGDSFSLFLFFMTILHPSTSIITFNLIQLYLAAHHLFLCPPQSSINCHRYSSLLTLSFYGTLYHYTLSVIQTRNLSNTSFFIIYVTIIVSCCCILFCGN